MSFSEEVRAELAAIAPERDCDRLAELSALFHFAGRLHLRGRGEVSLHLDLASAAVARRAFSLLRSFGVGSEIRTYRRRAFGRETRYQLHVENEAGLLARTGIVDARSRPRERPPRSLLGRACCRAAYLRGALLAAGSISGPPSPHLEIRCESRAGAETLGAVAGAEGAELLIAARGDHRSRTRRGSTASQTSWRSPARATPLSCSRSGRWSARHAPTRTGSPTRTTRISSAQAAPPTSSSRRYADCSVQAASRSSLTRFERSPSCASSTRRSPSETSAGSATRRSARRRHIGACGRLSVSPSDSGKLIGSPIFTTYNRVVFRERSA